MSQLTTTDLAFLHLLDCAIHARAPETARLAGVDWLALLNLAAAHKVDALLIDAVCLLPDGDQPEPGLLAQWQQAAMATMQHQMQIVSTLLDVLEALRAAGIKAVVLKGIALKQLYPQPDLRTMSDADLLVTADQYAQAAACIAALGFVRSMAEGDDNVAILTHPEGLRIELHRQMFERKERGFLARVEEESLLRVEDAVIMDVYGGQAWVMPHGIHALFMLLHMGQHLITSGFGMRQVTDFTLFLEAYDDRIDWQAFWREAQAWGLARFAAAVCAIGVTYLSLPRGAWAAAQPVPADADAAQALLLDLLDAGVFGLSSQERKRSAAIVGRTFDGGQAATSRMGRMARAVFPPAATLKAPYDYARRRPALLPIAWVHRWARYAMGLARGENKASELTKGAQIAHERMALLEKLGMREDE